jgi:hypothetical protein
MTSRYIFNLTEKGINIFEQYISTTNIPAPNVVEGDFYNSITSNYTTLKTSPVTTCYHVGEYSIYWNWYMYKSKNSNIYFVQLLFDTDIAKMYYINDVIFEKHIRQKLNKF